MNSGGSSNSGGGSCGMGGSGQECQSDGDCAYMECGMYSETYRCLAQRCYKGYIDSSSCASPSGCEIASSNHNGPTYCNDGYLMEKCDMNSGGSSNSGGGSCSE